MAFDAKRHVIKVQGGRDYLPVSARLRWFREEHPDWGIVTTPVEINLEKQYAIFSATIFNEDGKVMATATKMENVKGFGDYMEKAETGSVGRALAFCGYGTQYATELDDNSVRLNEGGGGGRFGGRPNNGGGFANAPGNGGGQRPNGAGPGMPPRPMTAQPAPQYAPPAPVYEEEPFESAPPPPAVRETTMREAPREMNGNGVNGNGIGDGAIAPGIMRGMDGIKTSGPKPLPSNGSDGDRPAPMAASVSNRPAPAGAPIARVREPEVEYADPGGDDDLPDGLADGEDPFGDDEPTTPAPAKAAPARPLARATANGVNGTNGAAEEAPSNRCMVDGCTNVLTASQLTMSVNKYGKPVCLVHQRDMAPADAGGKRPSAKALL